MSEFDNQLLDLAEVQMPLGSMLPSNLPSVLPPWLQTMTTAIGAVADVAAIGQGIYNMVTGGGADSGLPALPAPTAPGGMVLGGGMTMPHPARAGRAPKRSAQECLADPAVQQILRASQAGQLTPAEARSAIRAVGCGPATKKRRRHCAPGQTRRKMCVTRPSNVCSPRRRPRRATKSCGHAHRCSCRRRRHHYTAKQLAAGFGGKRRMR